LLTFKLTSDRQHLQLVKHDMKRELKDLQLYFRKRQKGYHFNKLYKRKLWDGYDKFIDQDLKIGVGLWKEIINFGKKYEYEINIEGLEDLLNLTFTKEQLDKFASVLMDGIDIEPYDYQLEAAHRALKYKFCSQELATSAGKTLILYIYISFLKRKGIVSKERKALIVVPNISLVGQTAEKFEKDYDTGLMKYKVLSIGGTNKYSDQKFEESELVISTYQSLKNKEPEFFKTFSVVCIDECHTSRGNSIKDILLASTNVEYKLGLSGTIKIEEQYSDFFKIQEFLGPLSMTLKSSFLIDQQHSPNVYIKMVSLSYPTSEPFVKQYLQLREKIKAGEGTGVSGKEMFDMERNFIVGYEPRIDFISSFVKKLGGNTLILFINVKDQYGQRICDRIKEWNEHAYYIDGGVDGDDRADYKNAMEREDGAVIVASYGTFSTGIDLKKVNHIIFAESYKSEITIRQSIGRGMRKLAGKHEVTIYDLVDDLDGYIVKHGKAREAIYVKEKFIISKHNFDLTKFADR
jgi:superfamily II DNA or RNA helicase